MVHLVRRETRFAIADTPILGLGSTEKCPLAVFRYVAEDDAEMQMKGGHVWSDDLALT